MTIVKVFVVVEDEADMRRVIRATLERDSRLQLVGEATTAAEALTLLDTVEPGLIVLDHAIDGEVMGLQAAPLFKARAPASKVLLFTAYDMARRRGPSRRSTPTCARTTSTDSCPPSSAS